MNKKVIPCKLVIVIEHNDDDVQSHILRYLKSMAASHFAYVFKNEYLTCYTSRLEIKLGKNQILRFELNPKSHREYQIYHFVRHCLIEILEKHPQKFGLDKGDKNQLDGDMELGVLISSGNNRPFFKAARKLFSLYDENKSDFERHDRDVIEACKKMMSEIKDKEGQPFYSFTEIK